MGKGAAEDTVVTWEDQQNINTFGRLNNLLHELDDDIKAKETVANDLEDAGNELILSDEDTVRYLTGEVLVHTPRDDVEALLEQLAEKNREEKEELLRQKEEVVAKMADLKAALYGKFKDQINLEE
eukprot:TRINITY_DN4520_c0_g1_i1.p1 TRINITY_DN4520_c0_g1~~TRINITY_DN4520_c0_g1_i1.p1  ORF type:complete len:126 (+),score=41.56 TRINITY_DN4520_c0_g1_i1:301-678(+)